MSIQKIDLDPVEAQRLENLKTYLAGRGDRKMAPPGGGPADPLACTFAEALQVVEKLEKLQK